MALLQRGLPCGSIESMSHVTIADRFALNPQQALFAEFYAELGDGTVAAVRAGYSSDSAQQQSAGLLRKPHVIAAIQYEARRRLVTAVPLALTVIERILKDDTASPKVRLDAAKTVLDRIGLVPPRAAAAKEEGERPLHERSAEELRDLATRLESELAGRAKTVSAPKAPASDANLADMID